MTQTTPPNGHKDPRTVLRKFIDGFTATAAPVSPPFDDPRIGGVGTEDDFLDYASEENINRARERDQGLQVNAEREADPLRLLNNSLDFLGEVGEEIVSGVAMGLDRPPAPKDTPYVLRTFNAGAYSWKTTVYQPGPNPAQIARKSEDRVSLEIVNLGTEPVFVTDESGSGQFGRVPNSRGIPVSKLDGSGPYSPVRIDTQDEVWVRTSTGIVCTVEVTETFGAPQKEVF